jgi:hypothetical protein
MSVDHRGRDITMADEIPLGAPEDPTLARCRFVTDVTN